MEFNDIGNYNSIEESFNFFSKVSNVYLKNLLKSIKCKFEES